MQQQLKTMHHTLTKFFSICQKIDQNEPSVHNSIQKLEQLDVFFFSFLRIKK